MSHTLSKKSQFVQGSEKLTYKGKQMSAVSNSGFFNTNSSSNDRPTPTLVPYPRVCAISPGCISPGVIRNGQKKSRQWLNAEKAECWKSDCLLRCSCPNPLSEGIYTRLWIGLNLIGNNTKRDAHCRRLKTLPLRFEVIRGIRCSA